MDLVTLSSRLSITDDRLTIDLAALDSPGAWTFLSAFFAGVSSLSLERVAPLEASADRLIVRGAGLSGPLTGLAVVLTFRASEAAPGELSLEIVATAADAWSLAAAFPAAAHTPFGGLAFARAGAEAAAILTVRTDGVPGAPPVLRLEGHALARTLALPAFLAAGDETVAVRGALDPHHITDPMFFPRFAPRSGPPVTLLGLDLDFDGWGAGAPTLPVRMEQVTGRLEAAVVFDREYVGWTLESAVYVSATLVVGELSIPLSARFGGPDDAELTFHANLDDALKTSLRALSSLIGVVSSPLDGLTLDELVDLVDLEVVLAWSGGAPQVQRVTAHIATREDLRWPLVPGLLTLDAIELTIDALTPLATTSATTVSVSGLVGVGATGAVYLTTTVARDPVTQAWAPEFEGSLDHDRPISVNEIVRHFVGTTQADVPELEVTNLSVVLAPATRSYGGALELAGRWRAPSATLVMLERVNFAFSRQGDAPIQFDAHAGLRIGEVWIDVSAAHAATGKGWRFSGSAGDLPAGLAMDALGRELGITFPALVRGLVVEEVGVTFDTGTEAFSARATAAFPIDGDTKSPSPARLTVHAELLPAIPPAQSAHATFGGTLRLLGRELDVIIDHADGAEDLLVASYDERGGAGVELRDLVGQLSHGFADAIPEKLSIQLSRARIALAKTTTGSGRVLVGVELGAGIELSKLPLVGRFVQQGQTLDLALQLVAASASFTAPEVARLNALGPAAGLDFPAAGIDTSASRVMLTPALVVAGTALPVGAPLALAGPLTPTSVPVAPAAGASDAVAWVPIQKAFGPFHFERVGVGLTSDKKSLALMMDASVELGGLTLTLAGLGAECALSDIAARKLTPHFHLDGLGIDFASGDLTLAGALIGRGSAGARAFEGAVTVKYRDLGILGVGAYQELDGQPSLFVFAQVDYPLGGPPFFFVEGLSFGFGYNRAIALPPLEALATFPLLTLAEQADHTVGPRELSTRLAQYVRPAEGQYFVAAGVKFNSFKLIHGQVLFVVAFGRALELDVLGLATVTSPPTPAAKGAPLLMKAELGLRGKYRPEEGDISLQGVLMPDAYLFAPACHLTGGFAFMAWMGTGDFVLTLGGYHTRFTPPAHYPKVPRLGLSWRVDENLALKAEAYFALTPGAIMAGGRLRADWESEDVHASFSAGIDCLVAWQPYHYDASADVSIAVAYRTWYHTFTADLAAELHVWGPSFSGTAHVKWWIFSFDIAFGDAPQDAPRKLATWAEVEAAFLPQGALLTFGAQGGKVAQHGKQATPPKDPQEAPNAREHLGIINPRELCISLRSAVPVTAGTVLSKALRPRHQTVGVVPMGRARLESTLTLTVTHAGGARAVDEHFEVKEIEQQVPAALWGTRAPDGLKDAALVPALTGFELRPRPTAMMAPRLPALDAPPVSRSIAAPTPGTGFRSAAGAPTSAAAARQARSALLGALLPDLPTDLETLPLDGLRTAPRRVAH